MPAFKKDDAVQIAAPLFGVVEAVKYNEDTGEPRYCVKWKGLDGDEHHRWFTEAELKSPA